MKKLLLLTTTLLLCTIIHVYGQAWTLLGADIDGPSANAQFGSSVAINSNGNTIIAGARFYNGPNGSGAGLAQVYAFDGSAWFQKGGNIDGETANDNLGWAASISDDGNTIAVGAPQNDGNGSNSGRVQVFTYNTGLNQWDLKGGNIDGNAGDLSGRSISISGDGNTIAIGGPFNNSLTGVARVYQFQTGSWNLIGEFFGEAANDQFGGAISLSNDGTTVAIGAAFNDGGGNDSGSVEVYRYNGATWAQLSVDIDGLAEDKLGTAVSLNNDGSVLAAGGPFNDETTGNISDNRGYVKVFDYTGSWVARPDIFGEAPGDQSGSSVDISSDGNTIVIGADNNNSGVGHARVYIYNGATWAQQGSDIDGELASDFSGDAVAISDFGTRVIIGALFNDGGGNASGHVRVYADPVLSIDSSFFAKGVVLYPNPSNGEAVIKLANTNSPITVTINNLLGQQVHQQQYEAGREIVLTNPLTAGIYVVTLKAGNETKTLKMIVE
ncbi:T9SS type A sorting domain-containing protein [Leptobacterium sp. I13]|uniref:T9SS type A sorting domain-containing protein n=1 Tax=Leptobacterium meishanense TaxID=3128904 RepID=UPI0030EC7D17